MDIEFFAMSAFAGIMGTYALLSLANWADSIGMPRLDFSRAMANVTFARTFDKGVAPGAGVDAPNTPYWPGVGVIMLNGIFFALLYSTWTHQYMPVDSAMFGIAPNILNGALWGVVLWFVSGVFYVPFYLREGFMLTGIHPWAWLTSLKVHGAYGMMVGWIAPVAG